MMVGVMSQLILKHTVLLTLTFRYGPTGVLMEEHLHNDGISDTAYLLYPCVQF